MRRRLRRLLRGAAALLLAGVWLAGPAPAAWAHAALKGSTPAAGARVEESPRQVVLRFAETPDPTLSIVRVVDAHGLPVAGAADEQPVPGAPDQLAVTLAGALPRGVYSVNWLVVSEQDGHVESGAFAFGVRALPQPGSVVEVPLQQVSAWADALAAAGHWLLYWGLALLLGGASTGLLVFGGRAPSGGLWLLRGALIAAAAGLCVITVSQRLLIGVPSLLPLFLTREGQLLLGLGSVLVLCALALVCYDLWPGRWPLAAVGALAAAAMLVHVFAGHAAAPTALRPVNLAAQWVHMMAIGTWIGGLTWLLLGIRAQERAERAAAVRTFSRVATFGLAVVLTTGVVRAAVQVGSAASLTGTTYGVTLLVKVALVVALVALGALNHFRLVPGMQSEDGAYGLFRLNSRVEIAVAAAVLATTAILVGLAPPSGV